MGILQQSRKFSAEIIKLWALKHKMPLILRSMPGAQSAPSQISRDYRPCHAALLNWQVMGPQPELHQSPELGKQDGKLKIGLCRHLAWPSKPAQIHARFCASRGGRARRIMQTSPFLLYASHMFLLKVCGKFHFTAPLIETSLRQKVMANMYIARMELHFHH